MDENKMPLTDSQLGIYLECIDENNYSEYLIPLSFRFPKDSIDEIKLANAFNSVAKKFSAFKTVIKTINQEPVMLKYTDEIPCIKVLEMNDSDCEQYIKDLFVPFSFDGNLLWRGAVIKTPSNTVLSLVFHHTIFDGTSIAVLNDSLSKAYNGEEIFESKTLFDYKIKEEEVIKSELSKEAEKYFENYFGDVECDSNPTPDKPKETNDNTVSSVIYNSNLNADEILKFAKENGVTENIVFLSAFSYTLCKINNQKNAVFSSVESGRFGGGYENSIGMFVKTFPLNIGIDEEISSSDLVKNVKTNFFTTLKNNKTNYSYLAKTYSGIGDVHFIYQGEILKAYEIGGVIPTVNVIDTYEPVSNFDVLVFKENGKYNLWFGYKNKLYTKQFIDCFADFYQTVLGEIIKNKKLCDFKLTSKKCENIIEEINKTEKEFDQSLTINKIFEDTVNKYPDKIAVKYNDKALTYNELNILTDKLGAYINKKGIGKDDFVSVLIPRNEYMCVTAMGIIKAGAAYQPLDPTYPKDRLDFMVSDSKSKLLIADRGLIDLLSDYKGDVLFTDEIDKLPNDDFNAIITPENAFVLIYTSGTTGLPKGCILENRTMVAFYFNHKTRVNLSEKSNTATIASFGFDAGVMDIFSSLMCGGTLYIIPDEHKLDIMWVEDFYNKNKITNGFMTTQLGRMFLEQTKCETLKYFVLGGEKLVPFTPPKGVMCGNFYGPSETLAYVCGYEIKDNSSLQPIGKPNGNTKLYITDSYNRLLPLGACGELCISGLQVGRGYFERPEKTAEVFVKNPFSNEKNYERMYKTGDVVRFLPDGNLEFIGRRDGQVKIRGFRIELTEIEQIVRAFKGIKNATVQAYDDAVSGKFVAAFIVSDEKIDIKELNAYILESKPPYMVPAVTMQIDEIPVNANGKVDKKKLPKPERQFEEVTKPKNELQKEIFDLIASVLGTEEFGIETDLYFAGLSSIGSIKLCSLIAEKFDKPIQMKDLKQNNNIIKLEKFINSNSDDFEKAILPDYPLSKTQEGIFVECISKPKSTFYNIPLLLKLSNNIDVEKLKNAITKAINAHSSVLTEIFTDENGGIRQKNLDDVTFDSSEIEVTFDEIEKIKEDLVKPFELTNSRLFRFKIIKGTKLYLFAEIHHIIADGTSLNILLNHIEKAYFGENIEKEKFTSFDIAYLEEQKRKTNALTDAKNFYDLLLDGVDMNFLPGADRLPFAKKDSGKLIINEKTANAESVKKYCEKNKISVNGFLNSAFGFVLAKYAGTEYSVYNTVYNGRNDSRAINTVGMLVKTIPVVCNIEKEFSSEIATEVSKQLTDSMANDIYSFAEISKDFGVNNDIVFVYQGDNFGFNDFCGEKAEKIDLDLSESKAPLTMEVSIENGKFKYISEYNKELFTEKLIENIILAYDKVISSFTNNEKVSEISLLTDEITRKLDEYNETEYEYDASKTITDLYREKALLYPDKLCVSYKNKKISYKDAYNTSLKIASYLSSKNIGKGDIVSILINRDENMVLTAHGVVMAGAAYLGLDPTYPKDRLEFMIEDSRAKIVIADRSLRNLIDGYSGDILYIDEIENLPPISEGFEETLNEITPDDKALVVYSSGTTGVPKGAVLCHKNIVCFYYNYMLDNDISEKSNIATYASFGFDGGAQDVFSSPMLGASLFVIPDEIRLDMEKLEQFYIQNEITNGFMTTQVGAMFMGNTKCKTLKNFMVGGEKFIPVLPPKGIRLYNGYGPSETMCYVNRYVVTDLGKLQPIGKVSRNNKEYIIDKFGNRLPFGACGELCISGGQTGLGYLNRPEKTEEVFVKNPFCNKKPYDRMYKTGDIVRLLPDGNYDFVGRRDGQVKIRGFRVELTEIEQQIRKFEGISNAAVCAYESASGGKYLTAYVVSNKEVDVLKLNEFIASEKPDYMVPSVTIQIDEIPLTSNGKVDKKKLPKKSPESAKIGAMPANETEEMICEVFEEVLGIDKVYADDDFFQIGGSSITAIKVIVKCNNLGYNIVFKNLFSNPTAQKLAEYIHNGRAEEIYAPKDDVTKDFDYSSLEYNTVDYVNEVTTKELGSVLLTGSTGFLGSHILKELLDNSTSKVFCLVRKKADMDAKTRFQMMMTYYFEDWFTEELKKRVTVIDGELGDVDIAEKLNNIEFNTIINSAANVKHFAAGDELLKDNYSGVENLIKLAEEKNALLVQISSTSVSGEAVSGVVSDDFVFEENNLNIGQSLENKYIYSKYQAEQAVIDAVSKGRIKGKIIRLGNLMARIDDSEFQINAGTSGFLKQFLGYKHLSMFPIDLMDKEIEFSPIDATAKAVVLLSGTPDKFTVFHAKNCNSIHYGYFINAMREEGININIVEKNAFNERYQKALKEEKDLSDFSTFIAYLNDNSGKELAHQIPSGCEFTTKALYRLGFAWPLISSDYLEKMVKTLIDLGFFE